MDEDRIREALKDIMAGTSYKSKYEKDMLDPEFRTMFQYLYWMNKIYRNMMEDYAKGDEGAAFCVQVGFDAWEARRNWEEFKRSKKGMIAVQVTKEQLDDAVECVKNLYDKHKFMETIKDKLKSMGTPDYLIDETAEEFYKKKVKDLTG